MTAEPASTLVNILSIKCDQWIKNTTVNISALVLKQNSKPKYSTFLRS